MGKSKASAAPAAVDVLVHDYTELFAETPNAAGETISAAEETKPAPRVVITGCPRAGKTTASEAIATELGVMARHTDALIETHKWGEDSIEVATWFDAPGPWVIEGVTCGRALRKWLASHPDGKPCDVVHVLSEPRFALTKGQETMRKGTATIWAGIIGELAARGVEIRNG